MCSYIFSGSRAVILPCLATHWPWWRHQMEALLAICAGNSPVTGEFPSQRPVTRDFGVFFDLCLNKRFSKHSCAGDLIRHRAHYDATVMIITWAVWFVNYFYYMVNVGFFSTYLFENVLVWFLFGAPVHDELGTGLCNWFGTYIGAVAWGQRNIAWKLTSFDIFWKTNEYAIHQVTLRKSKTWNGPIVLLSYIVMSSIIFCLNKYACPGFLNYFTQIKSRRPNRSTYAIPVDKRRRNNVTITSKRRHGVVLT